MRLLSRDKFNGWLFAAGTITLMATTPHSAYAVTALACKPNISSCGCTIITTGIYTVTENLTSSQGLTALSDCIDITAPNTILRLKGHSLTGVGQANERAIYLQSTATSSIVEGADNSGTPPESPLPDLYGLHGGPVAELFANPVPGDELPVVNLWNPAGSQAVISSWQIGVEIDADYSTIELFNQIGGTVPTKGNRQYGIYVNGASNVTLDDIILSNNGHGAGINGGPGIFVDQGGNNRIFDVTVDHSGAGGLALIDSNGNTIANITADQNLGDGIAVASSSDNQIFTFASNQNGLDGVSVVALNGTTVPSTGNHISNGSARLNGEFGVELDSLTSGNTVNELTETGADNEGDYDLVDDTGNCTANVWSNDLVDVGRGSPACVGQ
jgi:parallel beta-helix repeat protein